MTTDNARLLKTFAWEQTSIGDPATWPADMHAVIRTALASGFPVCTAWGDDHIQIYNDAYNPIFGNKHPGSFGAPVRESWPEIWEFLGPAVEQVKATREALWFKDTLLPLARHGVQEECYFDFSYSPVIDAGGRVLGVVSMAAEKTAEVVFQRRQDSRRLGVGVEESAGFPAFAEDLRDILTANHMDCAAAVLYSIDPYTANPGEVIWTVRAEREHVNGLRPAIARAARVGGLRTVEPGLPESPDDWAGTACLIPLHGRDAGLHAILVLIPHHLVPMERSLLPFAQTLSNRFHAMLHAAEARQAELGQVRAEMAEQEALYRFLFDNMRDGAIYCSTRGGPEDDEIVLAANPRACEMLGYSQSEVIGMQRSRFYFPGDHRLSAALKTRAQERAFLGELTLRDRNGQGVPVELMSNLVPLRSGEMRSLTIMRDVRHRQAVERERAERVRLETVTNITGGIAHDFNNLLTVMIGSIDTLLHELPEGSGSYDAAANAMLAAERAGTLTSQLVSYARRQTLVPRPMDLPAFLQEIRPLLASSLGEVNTLVLRLDPNCGACMADPTQLTTALLNLVVNARDAMPEGGSVEVRTYRVADDPLHLADDAYRLPPGQYVGLQVRDTGTGIPDTIRRRIFEPFFTTKEMGGGTGLGLSMVQGFMRQLGGDVRVSAASGGGTCIDLLFRAAPDDAVNTPRPPNVGQATGQKILHVEDNELVRKQTRIMLEQIGFQVFSARDADEALRYLDDGREVDLVLTDLVMPGRLSGHQLATEIRKRAPAMPIVITTGHDPRSVLSDDRDRAFDVLRKPYTRAMLAEILLPKGKDRRRSE